MGFLIWGPWVPRLSMGGWWWSALSWKVCDILCVHSLGKVIDPIRFSRAVHDLSIPPYKAICRSWSTLLVLSHWILLQSFGGRCHSHPTSIRGERGKVTWLRLVLDGVGSKLRLSDIRTCVLLMQEEPALGGIRSCRLLGNMRCNAGRGWWRPCPVALATFGFGAAMCRPRPISWASAERKHQGWLLH